MRAAERRGTEVKLNLQRAGFLGGKDMSGTKKTNRREFLKASTTVGAAAAFRALSINSRVYAAGSDIIRVGMVGCGGRNTGAGARR